MTQYEKTTTLPTVSIGMPTYNRGSMPAHNREKYIREAVDSILAQTFTDFELIISDDASTDGTEMIFREYAAKDTRIRYVRQPQNLGPRANWQFLLHEAQGDYFMWADDDDVVASNDFLSKLVDVIKEGNYDLVFPNVDLIESTNDESSVVVKNNVMIPFSYCKNRFDYCLQSIRICSHQIYGLFRRKSLIENYKYMQQTSGLRCYGEGLFVQAISSKLSICFVPDVKKLSRLHEFQRSRQWNAPEYLNDFVKHSTLCIRFWLEEAPLPFKNRIRILFRIFYVNGRYAIYLMMSSCYYFVKKLSHGLKK